LPIPASPSYATFAANPTKPPDAQAPRHPSLHCILWHLCQGHASSNNDKHPPPPPKGPEAESFPNPAPSDLISPNLHNNESFPSFPNPSCGENFPHSPCHINPHLPLSPSAYPSFAPASLIHSVPHSPRPCSPRESFGQYPPHLTPFFHHMTALHDSSRAPLQIPPAPLEHAKRSFALVVPGLT
jgi:hypothetical protein